MTAAAVRTNNSRPSASTHPALTKLSREAAIKFEKLRQLESKCTALRSGLADQQHTTRADLEDALRDLERFDRQMRPEATYSYEQDEKTGKRTRVPAKFPERDKLLQRIQSLRDEMARSGAEIAEAAPGYSCDGILQWLVHDAASSRFRALPAAKFVIPRGSSLADALAGNRAEQALLTERLADLENAHMTVSEAKARMRDEIAMLAERGRPDLSQFMFGGEVVWPSFLINGTGFAAAPGGPVPCNASSTVNDAFALVIWAHKDAILKRLDAEIEGHGDDTTAIPAAERPRLIAEAKAQLLALQHTEEAIICRLIEGGSFITRTCTDPRVLLGIDDGALAGRH